jgi:hypothetical protein
MNIGDVTFVVHWVPDGAANKGRQKDAAAWVELPLKMPRYGDDAFKKMQIQMYFRKDFFEQAYDKAAIVVAHEFSHVVLESIEHPLRRCEKAVELTAMLLGFRRIYDSASKDQRTLGYLERDEIIIANKLLSQDHWYSKNTMVSSLYTLIARLRNQRRRDSIKSPAPSVWRLVTASIGLLALSAYAVTFIEPTLNQLAPKRGNSPNVPIYSSPTPARTPAITSDEALTKHMDITLTDDAMRVQTRLANLGFYVGRKDGVWGSGSVKALSEFKLANGLAQDALWDANTEQALYADQPHRWEERFIGGWADDANDCQLAPITIKSDEVRSKAQVCEFNSTKREADGWRVQTVCKALPDGESEPRSYRFDVKDGRLLLSVGSDPSSSYVRCDPDSRY